MILGFERGPVQPLQQIDGLECLVAFDRFGALTAEGCDDLLQILAMRIRAVLRIAQSARCNLFVFRPTVPELPGSDNVGSEARDLDRPPRQVC